MKRVDELPSDTEPTDAEIFGIANAPDADMDQREQLFKNHPKAWAKIQRLMIERGMVWVRGRTRGNVANAYWEFGSWGDGGHLTIHGVIE